MLLGRVIGHATSTIKHASLNSRRLLLVQPLRSQTREPVIALDRLGADLSAAVVMTSDGRFTREFVGDERSPVRWTVIGLVDEASLTQIMTEGAA